MIRYETQTITPEIAKERIDLIRKASDAGLVPQRRVDQKRVARYARSMTAGRWQHNGQTLGVDEAGIPLNGMHRYLAYIASGVPFTSGVSLDVPRETLPTMDTGKSRTASNILEMKNYSYASEIASAANWIHRIRSGFVQAGSLDPEIVVIFVEKHPELQESAAIAVPIRKMLNGSIGIALHYLFRESDAAAADTFFEILKNGSNLDEGNPILLLRNHLINEQLKNKTRKTAGLLPIADMGVKVIHAWNAWKAGQTRQKLSGFRRNNEGQPVWPEIE